MLLGSCEPCDTQFQLVGEGCASSKRALTCVVTSPDRFMRAEPEQLQLLLDLYRTRLAGTREILEILDRIPATDPEGTSLERNKWNTRQHQELAMIERLERRLVLSASVELA